MASQQADTEQRRESSSNGSGGSSNGSGQRTGGQDGPGSLVWLIASLADNTSRR